ncbi:MAG TPA: 2-amino-4-hydroxy-6-hydroxymethyldihydropteridine diphosphokinase [Membranihabitans sp.]|nr:2-amino-4-hydroxy-6-hydroxymethyldihydropteridine diphosphokinase [Membranihabitans sp.]
MAISKRIFISLGSNIDDRQQFISKALILIEQWGIKILRKSGLYQSEPWGVKEQNIFLNQVIEVETDLQPESLLQALKSIENALGRVSRPKWHEREIDLDILYYDAELVDLPHLNIPHIQVRKRKFVLVPLLEIAPDFVDPQTGQTIDEILRTTPDTSMVSLLFSAT